MHDVGILPRVDGVKEATADAVQHRGSQNEAVTVVYTPSKTVDVDPGARAFFNGLPSKAT